VGTVTVRGVGPAELKLDPINNNYQAIDAIPNPPCPEGADVSMQSAGGAYDPFLLQAKCILPLEVTGPTPLPLRADQPLNLSWTPPGNAALTRIQIRVDISHHGGIKGEIVCDVPDNGALQIPASMTGQLIALGTAGFPMVYLTRISTASAMIPPGRVALNISSLVKRDLDVPGIISCVDTSECPPGKTCQSAACM
jgi:hypothetical protein